MPSVGENARYRRAHALIARWASGRFVVDNYLTRDRIELTPALLQLEFRSYAAAAAQASS